MGRLSCFKIFRRKKDKIQHVKVQTDPLIEKLSEQIADLEGMVKKSKRELDGSRQDQIIVSDKMRSLEAQFKQVIRERNNNKYLDIETQRRTDELTIKKFSLESALARQADQFAVKMNNIDKESVSYIKLWERSGEDNADLKQQLAEQRVYFGQKCKSLTKLWEKAEKKGEALTKDNKELEELVYLKTKVFSTNLWSQRKGFEDEIAGLREQLVTAVNERQKAEECRDTVNKEFENYKLQMNEELGNADATNGYLKNQLGMAQNDLEDFKTCLRELQNVLTVEADTAVQQEDLRSQAKTLKEERSELQSKIIELNTIALQRGEVEIELRDDLAYLAHRNYVLMDAYQNSKVIPIDPADGKVAQYRTTKGCECISIIEMEKVMIDLQKETSSIQKEMEENKTIADKKIMIVKRIMNKQDKQIDELKESERRAQNELSDVYWKCEMLGVWGKVHDACSVDRTKQPNEELRSESAHNKPLTRTAQKQPKVKFAPIPEGEESRKVAAKQPVITPPHSEAKNKVRTMVVRRKDQNPTGNRSGKFENSNNRRCEGRRSGDVREEMGPQRGSGRPSNMQ